MYTEFYTDVFQRGNYIYHRGVDSNNERISRRELFQPYLFHKSKTSVGSPYKTIHDEQVVRKNFEDINDCKDFLKRFDGVDGMPIYGLTRWPYVFIYDNYKECIPNTKKINIAYIDIEVRSDDGFPEPDVAEKEITAIAVRIRNKKIVFGCGDYKKHADNIFYIKCQHESQMLLAFLDAWERLDVDVLTGWNTEFFDIPYIINRIRKLLGEEAPKRLSPWGIIRENRIKSGFNEDRQTYNIYGIQCLDYLSIYKKFQLSPRESYRLDYIAEVELGRKKVDYSEHGNLFTLYKEDYQKFIEYNIEDVDLVYDIDQNLGYLDQIFAIAYDAGVNYTDALASVLIWDVIIHNYLMNEYTVVPANIRPGLNERTIEGGHVKPPIVGMHNWVMSFDLNSLYPHLIQQYNISPEMRISPNDALWEIRNGLTVDSMLNGDLNTALLKKYDVTVTPNGQFYQRNKVGFLPTIMRKMYDDRVQYKSKMIEAKKANEVDPSPENEILISRYHNLQLAKKIQLNSAYGALANAYFRWYDLENAEAITKAGQLSIRWIEIKINEYLNKLLKTDNKDYVLAADTDSVYVCLDELVKKIYGVTPTVSTEKIIDFLDNVSKEKLQPFIDESYAELAEYVNAYEQRMFMKRENIANKAIWTAKKRYIMNVYDSEGIRYSEPDLKMMGIEAIRSSTPSVCRNYIKQTLKLMMNSDEQTIQDYIAKIREEFKTLKFEDIAFPRSVTLSATKKVGNRNVVTPYSDSTMIYRKGTPIQVKGALLYNHYLKELKLTKQYEEIKDGEKIKFCYLKTPNVIRDRVISCPINLPPEFNLDSYLDYETQFVKGYLDPIDVILNVIGWHHEKRSTLLDFFS